MEKAQEDNDKLVNENAQHTHDINELDKLLSDIDNKKQQIERDLKVTGKENRDQYALIKKKLEEDELTKEKDKQREEDKLKEKREDNKINLYHNTI